MLEVTTKKEKNILEGWKDDSVGTSFCLVQVENPWWKTRRNS